MMRLGAAARSAVAISLGLVGAALAMALLIVDKAQGAISPIPRGE